MNTIDELKRKYCLAWAIFFYRKRKIYSYNQEDQCRLGNDLSKTNRKQVINMSETNSLLIKNVDILTLENKASAAKGSKGKDGSGPKGSSYSEALIKGANIYIEDNLITEIGCRNIEAAKVINGKGMLAMPGLVNTHTHAAMTLLRSLADDMKLQPWLTEKIWPLEAKLTGDDVYWGTRLACLEMIRSGTTCFNDMYWHLPSCAKAVDDSGMRGVLAYIFIDNFDEARGKELCKNCGPKLNELAENCSSRVKFSLGPHAVYTVSLETLSWISEYSRKHKLGVHFHLSETAQENLDFEAKHKMSPAEKLAELGLLHNRAVAAHCVYLSKHDKELLGRYGVNVSYNPVSNMKLAVGQALDHPGLCKAGANLTLGTDGASSNNNLDMFESLKFASLLQKHTALDPTALSAPDAVAMATRNGARALGIDSGIIQEGKLADIILLNRSLPEFTPNLSTGSNSANIVYSCNGYCVDTTICDGQVLMHRRRIKGERKVLEMAREAFSNLISR